MSISVLNTDAGLSGKTIVNLEDGQTVTGLKTYDRDPNAPFAVTANSAVVPNLIAESLSGGTVAATTGTFSGTLGVTGIFTGRMMTVTGNTQTGAQNNWSPTGQIVGTNYISWAGASALTVTGIGGGTQGQLWMFQNTGGSFATFAYNSGSSDAANRLINFASSAATPVAPGGFIAYVHDGSLWRMIAHEQGAWITPTFAAGDYTASSGDWTVAAGDVQECEYRLVGRTLHWNMILNATTVSATPATLVRIVPGGFTASQAAHILTRVSDNAAAAVVGLAVVVGGSANVSFYPTVAATAAWSTATDTTVLTMCATFEVT